MNAKTVSNIESRLFLEKLYIFFIFIIISPTNSIRRKLLTGDHNKDEDVHRFAVRGELLERKREVRQAETKRVT